MSDEATAEVAPTIEQPRDDQGRFAEPPKEGGEQPETVEEGEETSEDEQQSSEDGGLHDKKRRGKGAEARIDELTRKFREQERRAEYFERLATGQQAPPSAQEAAPRPKLDDFADYDAYIDALTDWKVDQKLETRNQSAQQQAQAGLRATTWESRVEEARSSIADYDTVVGSSELPIAAHVADALMDSERGPELAYHMATHPEVVDRLNRMSPVKAAMELGKLETSLTAPVVKAASKAPPPVSPIKTTASTQPTDLSRANMDDYIEMRRKQGASWAR